MNAEPRLVGTVAARSVIVRVLTAVIFLYRSASANRRPACRFVPSCSEYAEEALARYGARTGLALAARRLLRCRPGGPFGFDPVPDDPVLGDLVPDGTPPRRRSPSKPPMGKDTQP